MFSALDSAAIDVWGQEKESETSKGPFFGLWACAKEVTLKSVRHTFQTETD